LARHHGDTSHCSLRDLEEIGFLGRYVCRADASVDR